MVLVLHERFSALHKDRTFWICNHHGNILGHLQNVGFHVVSGLAGTGSADYDHVLVPGIPPVFGTAVHGQKFRPGQDDVVVEDGIDKWSDVLCRPPSGGTVFLALPVFLRVLPAVPDDEFNGSDAGGADQQIPPVKAGKGTLKGQAEIQEQVHQLLDHGISGAVAVKPCFLLHDVENDEVGDVGH